MILSRLGSKVHTAFALPRREWLTLAQAWVMLLAIDLSLRRFPFRQVQEFLDLGRRNAGFCPEADPSAAIQRTVWLVGAAARHHFYPMRCLQRTLALQWLLGRRGIQVDLRIGVERDEAGLVAHSWLEHRGQPIGQPEGIESRFVPLLAARTGT